MISVAIPDDVAAAIDRIPAAARKSLLALRALIHDVAASTQGVGTLIETLKWGQPSYHTVQPKSGSPIRLGLSRDKRPALFCHCQTSLIAEFRDMYPDNFDFEGNRALVLKQGVSEVSAPLAHCIARALTYHLHKP